jgi:hypothetical protein
MIILFICGTLAPGRDGVGDYARRLSGELIRRGHLASVIAWRDRYAGSVAEEWQEDDGIAVKTLRIPHSSDSHTRIIHARKWIAAQDPDWISLQFVPYAYHRKGLPKGLSHELRAAGKGRRWHMLFHEIWTGAEKGDPFWFRLRGWPQRRLVSALVKQLRPSVIHTNCATYQKALSDAGIAAERLPVFSNIPFMPAGAFFKSGERPKRIVHFGAIHRKHRARKFAAELKQVSAAIRLPVSLVIIGEAGKNAAVFKRMFENQGITTVIRGALPVNEIVAELNLADWGITTLPAHLSEKSGTIAAMALFGLPVISIGPIPPEGATGTGGAVVYIPGNLRNPDSLIIPVCHTLSEVCSIFVKALRLRGSA